MSAQRAAQLVEAGLWLQMSGDVEGARRLFEQALKLDPGNARAQQLLATAPATPAPPPSPPYGSAGTPESSSADRGNESGLDWSSVTGLDTRAQTPPGMTPRGHTPPPSIAPLSAAPPPLGPGGDELNHLGFQPLAEPMPPRAEFSGTYPDPDDVPIQLPPPEPLPHTGGTVIRPINFAPNATSAWDSQSNPGVHLQDVTNAMGDAMDLVAEPSASSSEAQQLREEIETLLNGARDLLDLDDHSGAIELILKAQALSPNDPQVQEMRERSEKTLQAMFESKLGDMSRRPRVALKDDEIIWLNLDHRAGFVLAQIDGSVSFEDLFEVCGMSRLDTARILAQLVEEGVISA